MPNEKSPQILSGFVLKLFAIVFMTLDHVGLFMMAKYSGVNEALYQTAYVFRCLGRIAMPLYFLMVAEAVHHTHKPWKYFFRLLAMHLVITVGLSIYIYGTQSSRLGPNDLQGNAFADLSLIALTLILFRQRSWRKAFAALPIAFAIFIYVIQTYERANDVTILWFPGYLRTDYSLMGLLIGIGFYFARPLARKISFQYIKDTGISMEVYEETKSYQKMVNLMSIAFFFAIVAAFWGISYIGYNYDARPYDTYWMQLQSYCMLAIPFIFLYSGKRGFDSKPFRVFNYLYYPVHIAIIFLIFSI